MLPSDCKYTKEHEWVRLQGSNATVGITEFAQSELGEIVFVDLPELGKQVKAGETLCVVESTKAASDVYAPISGKVVEVNSQLSSSPEQVNQSPFESGWLVKIEPASETEISKLMSAEEYSTIIGG